MFNFFKSKTHLIPADLSKGMMTSNFCTIKIDEKLTIPDYASCLICYKDKVYYELNAGTYTLSKEMLIDIYQKQSKHNRKIKNLKLDFYFATKTRLVARFC